MIFSKRKKVAENVQSRMEQLEASINIFNVVTILDAMGFLIQDADTSKKWFAVSASVCKKDNELGLFTSINKPIAIKASSEEEACGIGIKEMQKLFPVEQGWYNHQASAVEVPAS